MKKRRIVISGSLRKNSIEIKEIINEFRSLGIEVLSPKLGNPINPDADFIFLDTDLIKDPKKLELFHLNAIKKAKVLYIHNIDGYIGPSATLELGWALALGKKVFCKEIPTDFTLKFFCKVANLSEIAKLI